MYGDENYTNFFRRLTFSPDGAFLLTPAGHFEDPTVVPSSRSTSRHKTSLADDPPVRPKRVPSGKTGEGGGSKSSVYIYSRANFSRPPIAHLPGHKKASVAVRFSPLLYELRPRVIGANGEHGDIKRVAIERGKEQTVDLDLGGSVNKGANTTPSSDSPVSAFAEGSHGHSIPRPPSAMSARSTTAVTPDRHHMHAPAPRPPSASPSTFLENERGRRMASPMPVPAATGSVFSLPYRMLFAVATQDTVTVYDTQQAGPVCMFSNLHYTSFTDMAW